MTENDYMEIQEKLSKLFDGELDDTQAQGVLNEVANNSELEALYLEQKTLHSYMQNPYLPETAGLKEGILKRIKLDSASIRKYRARKYILRTALVGLVLLTLGGGYLWLTNNNVLDKYTNNTSITEVNKNHNDDISDSKISTTAIKPQIPIVTQTNLDTRSANTLAENNKSYSRKSKKSNGIENGYLAQNTNEANSHTKSELSAERATAINTELSANGMSINEAEAPQRNLLAYSNLFSDTRVAREQYSSLPKYYLNPVYNYKTALILDRLNLQFNWYGLSKSSPNFKPENSKTGLINDFSLFLMYDVTEKTSLGLSFGYDNFLMQYDGWEKNTHYLYSQEYSTPWIGCNIEHRFEPIFSFADYYEVSPFIQLNTAYANVGIYTQASTGVEVEISANTSLIVGFNSGWLFYKYENYEYTNKNGLNIGLKYGF
ncbi:MAG: hypothetical protein WCR42_09665 [bacterium]